MTRLLPFVLLALTVVVGRASPYRNRQQLEEDGNALVESTREIIDDDEEDVPVSSMSSDKQRSAKDSWNAQHCQVKGCKPMTDSMLSMSEINPGAKDSLVNRNLILDPLFNLPTGEIMKPISLDRNVPYLGVLLDAGRHYFPIDWIRNMLQVMHAMGYNLLHFRLTDDQAFNIQLDSMPELANPALDSSDGRVYTPTELKELVAYAKSLDIVIMPEINLPGHAGAWAGNHTPDLIVPCAKDICYRGYGLPLNLKHPKLMGIVRIVLKEVLSIFSTAPFLHLGGDEVHMISSCLKEANYVDFDDDYATFEEDLRTMLEKELNYSPANVVRWETTTGNEDNDVTVNRGTKQVTRAGEIVHYWYSRDYQSIAEPPPVLCSEGLYFDTNGQEGAWEIFETTRRLMVEPKPRAVIAGTLELSTHQWMDRNVVGRLLAVAMGVSSQNWDMNTFRDSYVNICRDDLHFDDRFCDLQGAPPLDEFLFGVERSDMHAAFQDMLCQNLTTQETRKDLAPRLWAKHDIYRGAMANFWDHFGDDPPEFASSLMQAKPLNDTSRSLDFLRKHQPSLQYRGIILDLVQIDLDDLSMSRILATLDLMNLLGLNMLQLRIMSDMGFAVEIPKHPNLAWGHDASFTKETIESIVDHAESLGIHVIPEITTSTRAGGWFSAGILANCPQVMCQKGIGIGANATDEVLVASTISLMHQLLELFHHPPYLHLGYDEREEVKACYDEANLKVDLDNFEHRLIKALKFQDFNLSKLIRWENSEGIVYPRRAGEVTHYRRKTPTRKPSNNDPFFISSGLDFGDPDMSEVNAWGVFEKTRELLLARPIGILACVELVHETFWKDFAVVQRLVAFSMGLSSSSDWTRVDFQKILKTILSFLKVEDNLEGEFPDASLARQHLEKHRQLRTNITCDARTAKHSKHVPRKGPFLLSGIGSILAA